MTTVYLIRTKRDSAGLRNLTSTGWSTVILTVAVERDIILSCSQHRSRIVKDPFTECRSDIGEDPALVTAHDLLVQLLACRTRRFSYSIGMRMNEGIRKIRSPSLLVSVKNNRSEILSRMETLLFTLPRARITTVVNERKRSFLLNYVSYYESKGPAHKRSLYDC